MSKSGGHSTTTIARPKDPTSPRTKDAARPRSDDTGLGDSILGDSILGDSILGDLTRPIPADKRLVQGRGKRGVIALGAFVVTAALVAALFVLPVQAWLRQEDDIDAKRRELTALEQANAELTDEVNRLNTPEGIEEAAREEIGYVERGEIRLTVLPMPTAPMTMPSGWPYDAIAGIVTARSATPAP